MFGIQLSYSIANSYYFLQYETSNQLLLYSEPFTLLCIPQNEDHLWYHPYQLKQANQFMSTKFTPEQSSTPPLRIIAHIDRIGYRLPDFANTRLRNNEGSTSCSNHKKHKLQRSLTPHLDCCPSDMQNKIRWRPIQCMLALTSTLQKEEGGFECVKGFHRIFKKYYASHTLNRNSNMFTEEGHPCVCKGNFCPIRPSHDQDILSRFSHIAIPAGSAVFWDQRIPHANSRQNKNRTAREVVYGGYLPRTTLNDVYAKKQIARFYRRLPQVDFWIETKGKQTTREAEENRKTTSEMISKLKASLQLSNLAVELITPSTEANET